MSFYSRVHCLVFVVSFVAIFRGTLTIYAADEDSSAVAVSGDPYLWLEDIHSSRSMDWVNIHNKKTLESLEKESRYATLQKEVSAIELSRDRIPSIQYLGGFVYNFWQDQKAVRGIWRRTTLQEYKKKNPRWDVVLDLDQLNRNEKKNWVWKNVSCLPPEYEHCMIQLSPGGQDASEFREFDVKTRTFVKKNGFYLPEAKSYVSWYDENTLLVGTNLGEGSLTRSGYPRTVRLWKRGQLLTESKEVFHGEVEDVSVTAYASIRPEEKRVLFLRSVGFFEQKVWTWDPESQAEPKLIPFPLSAKFVGSRNGQFFAVLRDSLATRFNVISAGSLISLKAADLTHEIDVSSVKPGSVPYEVIYRGKPRNAIEDVYFDKNSIYISLLKNINSKLIKLMLRQDQWVKSTLPLPQNGTLSVTSCDPFDSFLIVQYENFVSPTTLYAYDATRKTVVLEPIKNAPSVFLAQGIAVDQKEARSKDGTYIPYFLIRKKNKKNVWVQKDLPRPDFTLPTILSGYGGFEVSIKPFYLSSWGKIWLEQGGALAFANIRGGGEFGPLWHKAAMQEKRQTAYDDFIAVAEHLESSGVTSPQKLAIQGASNGGLLVGAVAVQRPELFAAVVTDVPLLDMMRYHLLLAGASWKSEFGNPEDSKIADALRKYSPYQNLTKNKVYPKFFFLTSTQDDRVHPGHARKMAAKMEEYGYSFDYFENTNGGHGGSADLTERVHKSALEFTFLFRELFSPPKRPSKPRVSQY